MYYSDLIDGKHYQTIDEVERQVILIRLKRFDYSRRKTAKSLGRSVQWLWLKLKKYRLEGQVIPDDPNHRPVIEYSHNPTIH